MRRLVLFGLAVLWLAPWAMATENPATGFSDPNVGQTQSVGPEATQVVGEPVTQPRTEGLPGEGQASGSADSTWTLLVLIALIFIFAAIGAGTIVTPQAGALMEVGCAM